MGATAVFLGDPVMDLLVSVSDDFLETNRLCAGGCETVDTQALQALLDKMSAANFQARQCTGGSAANSAKALACFSESTTAVFVGMIGPDQPGRTYQEALQRQHVHPQLIVSSSGSPTALCLCLVTGDGERTMRTCLSAAAELRSPEQLPAGWNVGMTLLHLEGYSLYRPAVAEAAMKAARAQQALVSMDLASFELVEHCHDTLDRLLKQGLLDLVFCNLTEANALAKARQLADRKADDSAVTDKASTYLLQHAKVCVISMGAQGSVAFSREGECAMATPPEVSVADTVGAGDCHTAGFLHAYLTGAPLVACLQCGCTAGSAVVQCEGAELSAKHAADLRKRMQQILSSHSQEL